MHWRPDYIFQICILYIRANKLELFLLNGILQKSHYIYTASISVLGMLVYNILLLGTSCGTGSIRKERYFTCFEVKLFYFEFRIMLFYCATEVD